MGPDFKIGAESFGGYGSTKNAGSGNHFDQEEHGKKGLAYEHIFLTASVLCLVVGLFTFSIPAFLCYLSSWGFAFRKGGSRHVGIILLGILISQIGVIAGLIVSSIIWSNTN